METIELVGEYKKLAEYAERARRNAYAPYSGYKVGAALLTEKGNIYTGSNVENVSYGLSICAERVSVFKAVTSEDMKIDAVAVCGPDEKTPPCGACRQVIREFGSKIKIILPDRDLKKGLLASIDELLHFPFSAENN